MRSFLYQKECTPEEGTEVISTDVSKDESKNEEAEGIMEGGIEGMTTKEASSNAATGLLFNTVTKEHVETQSPKRNVTVDFILCFSLIRNTKSIFSTHIPAGRIYMSCRHLLTLLRMISCSFISSLVATI